MLLKKVPGTFNKLLQTRNTFVKVPGTFPTGEKMTFFRDPDGLPIEIHE